MDKWYIIHTRPRWEKKVADCLAQKGIKTYCPVKSIKRKWSDRVKVLQIPVFKSCVFVKMTFGQRTDVRLIEGVVNFIYADGKPAQVSNRDIKSLQKILSVKAIATENHSIIEGNEKFQLQSEFQLYPDKLTKWLVTGNTKPKLV